MLAQKTISGRCSGVICSFRFSHIFDAGAQTVGFHIQILLDLFSLEPAPKVWKPQIKIQTHGQEGRKTTQAERPGGRARTSSRLRRERHEPPPPVGACRPGVQPSPQPGPGSTTAHIGSPSAGRDNEGGVQAQTEPRPYTTTARRDKLKKSSEASKQPKRSLHSLVSD